MRFTTLISIDEVAAHLGDANLAVIDCRFTLGNTGRGKRDHLQAHIPGAVYAHLDDDLCSPVIPGITGRHPLPGVDQLTDRFSRWGIDGDVQVVAYDDWPGIGLATAARLWWSLRWLGHLAVAVLDGGWERWLAEGLPVQAGEEARGWRKFVPDVQPDLFISTEEVEQVRLRPDVLLLDARSADRFRGENETIDPIAGHIPGAISAPFMENLGENGRFLPPSELRRRFETLFGEPGAKSVVTYCGSGVTAAVNNLAMAHAGLGEGRLYAGSWSEWITSPERPVENDAG